MLPDRSIAANLAVAPALSTLAGAVNAAGFAATLGGPGPFTLFAPDDAAFAHLAPGIAAALLLPENRATLVALLRYHVVPGRLTTADLLARIDAGNGAAILTTLAGQPIRATMTTDVITLTSATGNRGYVAVADLGQTNGIVHIVNGVLIPTLAMPASAPPPPRR